MSFAKEMQDAGAKGIELNVYYIPDRDVSTGAEVEQQYLDVLSAVKAAVTIPVAVKVGPYFSSFANMAGRLDAAGADALVLFNRFYQPDFDIETRDRRPVAHAEPPDEIRLPLLWIALLLRPREGVAGGDDRRARCRRGDQVPDGGRRRRDEHVGAAAAGPGVFRASHRRDVRLDGEEGLRVGRPDARIDEPAVDHRTRPRSCAATTSRSSRATRRPRSGAVSASD